MLLRNYHLAAAAFLVTLGCQATKKPEREATAHPVPVQAPDYTRAATEPYCCEDCYHTEDDGLHCQACSPAPVDHTCPQKRVDCGDNVKTWDDVSRELVCED